MSIETRIVSMADGTFVPQYKVKHFLWGHHWESLYLNDSFGLWSTSCSKSAEKLAKTSYKEAEGLIERFIQVMEDRGRLESDK